MDKTIKYERTCQKNPKYPIVRLVCGDIEYILKRGGALVRSKNQYGLGYCGQRTDQNVEAR